MAVMRGFLLLLLLHIFTGTTSGNCGSTCDACHKNATCKEDKNTSCCFCREGFAGDGLNCYDQQQCNSSRCCHEGYQWTAKGGCEDIDECRLPLCKRGMDCIDNTCADPCSRYSRLEDDWRSVNNTDQVSLHCDRYVYWQGWYRMFLDNKDARIPERCIEKRSSSCCLFPSHDIHVKLCPGNYYVYKLLQPSACHLAYCAEENPPAPAPPAHFDLICGRDNIQVGVQVASMMSSQLDPFSGNLAANNCSLVRESDGIVWYETETKEGACGNKLKTNGTHAIYFNALFLYSVDNSSFSPPETFPFSCAYALETDTSLDVAIRPILPIDGGVSGVGAEATASMSLFPNASFTEPYAAGVVTLPLGSPLYVGVSVQETDPVFAVVLEDCFATNSQDINEPNPSFFQSLIENKCPANRREVAVISSGSSLRSRFSAVLFLFQNNDFEDVYIHCQLSLCDQRNFNCVPSCHRKVAARSISSSEQMKAVSVGPIHFVGRSLHPPKKTPV
ncbi:uromodulin-like [Pholidichthys leucotaenia]